MPGIQLSSVLITTDTPLLFFPALTIWACVELPRRLGALPDWLAAHGRGPGPGVPVEVRGDLRPGQPGRPSGLSREARRAWTPVMAVAFFAALFVVFAPNLIWNYQHHFSTLEHTAANANWKAKSVQHPWN
jgi:hypothetical protein